jgi:hypothetical protein
MLFSLWNYKQKQKYIPFGTAQIKTWLKIIELEFLMENNMEKKVHYFFSQDCDPQHKKIIKIVFH